MTAGILHHLGVDMGPAGLQPPNPMNPAGYFEDWRLMRFHRWRSALEYVDGDEFRRRMRMPPLDPAFTPDQAARYRRVVAACEAPGRPWGFKDPELTYYMPRFVEAVRRGLRLVVPRRPEEESIVSLLGFSVARPIPAADARRAIGEYRERLDLLVASWPGPVLNVDFHECLREPARVVAAIADFVGLEPNESAIAFVAPRLSRHGRGPG
jgi:hypothetical protein